jgi:tetratricopeptide (TPR) repeat protein
LTLNKIGNVHYGRSDWDIAIGHYTKALSICRKVLGEEHPNTAASIFNIGNVYAGLDDLNIALEHYTQALKIERKALGEEHPSTIMSLNAIGETYFANGDLKQALEFGQQALNAWRKTLGASHAETITSTVSVARTLNSLNRREEAFNLIAPYIQDPPSDSELASKIKALAQILRAKPFRPGFRVPPTRGKKKSKKSHR